MLRNVIRYNCRKTICTQLFLYLRYIIDYILNKLLSF